MEYRQPTLSNFRAEKGYYTTKEVSELYHITTATVCNWIRKGWLKADMREPISKNAKTMRGRYRIFPDQIEDVESHKEELIEASRKYWVGLLVKIKKQ